MTVRKFGSLLTLSFLLLVTGCSTRSSSSESLNLDVALSELDHCGDTLPQDDTEMDTPSILRYQLETETACGPPCWSGLIPGQSSRREAIDVLSQYTDNAISELDFPVTSLDLSTVVWGSSSSNLGGMMSFDKGRVLRSIVLKLGYQSNITISEMIQEFGTPDGYLDDVTFEGVISGESALSSASYQPEFVWLSKGFGFSTQAIAPIMPEGCDRVWQLYYAEPTENVTDYLEVLPLHNQIDVNTNYHDWLIADESD